MPALKFLGFSIKNFFENFCIWFDAIGFLSIFHNIFRLECFNMKLLYPVWHDRWHKFWRFSLQTKIWCSARRRPWPLSSRTSITSPIHGKDKLTQRRYYIRKDYVSNNQLSVSKVDWLNIWRPFSSDCFIKSWYTKIAQ